MSKFLENEEEDKPLIPRLSQLHRRIFPLSLFETPERISPSSFSLFPSKMQTPQLSSSKKQENLISLTHPYRIRQKKTSIPPLKYVKIREKSLEETVTNRSIYHPYEIRITPRSKMTVYTNSLIGSPIAFKKNKRITGNKKRSISEIAEEQSPSFKLKRISSSKISFPATSIGQIMIRVRDLVLDPLKQELSEHKIL